jgi:transcription elongation GreA/GreB family factor
VAPNKRKVVEEIQAHLAEELKGLLPSAEKAESGEASMPEGTASRIREIQQQLTMYRFLPMREYGADDVVVPSALVELELSGRRAFYLVVPSGGGLVMKIEGHPIQVVTPQSPLGNALLGKRLGDTVRVETAGAPREYVIVSMC